MNGGREAAVRDAPIGGQAVVEGVMMRGVRSWAVAVRLPPAEGEDAGDIEVHSNPLRSVLVRRPVLRLPVLRGVVALYESLSLGFRALALATNAQAPEQEDDIPAGVWAGTVVVALLLAVGLFFAVPVGLTSLVRDQLGSAWLFWLVEGLIRSAMFVGYLVLISRLAELRRVFEYHGAEHKTIACHEAGLELTPENAATMSRLHPRCGTSFLLVVMVVAIFAFAPIGLPAWYWLLATRILGVPVIAGLSFELIKLTARHREAGWARLVTWPGMQLQKLTTREPDASQLEVAIAALDAVLERENRPGAPPVPLVGAEVAA